MNQDEEHDRRAQSIMERRCDVPVCREPLVVCWSCQGKCRQVCGKHIPPALAQAFDDGRESAQSLLVQMIHAIKRMQEEQP